MKKRLVLILNGKGGVGKSFFAVNFIQYLKDHRVKHVAVDTDNENSTLKRFHTDANFLDLSNAHGIDPIFAELTKRSLVVADCRAASTDILVGHFNKLKIFNVLKELDAMLTLVLPISNDPDSLNQLQILTEQFDKKTNYIVVKNRFFGEQFDIYDNSKTRIRLLDDLDGMEIEMPVLDAWLVVALNQAAITISPAIRSDKFFIMDRQRLVNWQREFYDEINSVAALLLPRGESPVKRKEVPHE